MDYGTEEEFRLIAPGYDDDYPALAPDDPMITFMRGHLDQGDRIVEFGIGTGRVAIPLAQSGLRVSGIDLSEEMLKVLGRKPEALGIETVHGSFLEQRVSGTFAAVVCVFNTLYHVHDQQGQELALRKAAEHIPENGLIFLENTSALHLMSHYQATDRLGVFRIEPSFTWLLAGRVSQLKQELKISHIKLRADGSSVTPVTLRYIWPSELHLMARQAGLEVVAEHGDWDGRPFDTTSKSHIVILRKRASLPS
ncbi:class I SAM-dependent methyltransferase [Streptomyces vinaceus]|uniref:class I SAM-dependent methyltransferase n=1 Tax=Streptomyces vinaceus TaxID=1960 RepID=UPI0035DEF107